MAGKDGKIGKGGCARRSFWLAAAMLAFGAASATFPTVWGPRVLQFTLLSVLPHGEGAENRLTVRKVSPFGVEVADVALGGMPMAPSCRYAVVRFSPGGLRGRRIESVEVRGLSVDPAHRVESFSMPSPGRAGARRVPDDPLRGWTLGRLCVDTEEVNFAPALPPQAQGFLSNTRANAMLNVSFDRGRYVGSLRGRAFGGDLEGELGYSPASCDGRASLSYTPALAAPAEDLGSLRASAGFRFSGTNGPSCTLDGRVGFDGCAWSLGIAASAGAAGFEAKASLERTRFSEAEPLVAAVLARLPIPADVRNLRFSGDVSASAEAAASGGGGPKWSAAAKVEDASAEADLRGVPLGVRGGRARVAAGGVGDFWKLSTIPVSFTNASAGMLAFDKGRALLMADGKNLMVSEAAVGFCGGFVRLYALYLSFGRLTSGFTVVLDNLQAGEFIGLFPKLAGSAATGRLYGRLPMRIVQGPEVRLGDGFLYAPPGETGNIKIRDTAAVAEALAGAGVPEAVCRNLGKALQNLNYEILRFDLSQPRSDDGLLAIRLQGESPDGRAVTPVNLNISINGPVERLLNLAIKTARLGGR